MIYFFSDPYVYSFENLYPLYLKFKEEGFNCVFDANFCRQGGLLPPLHRSFSGFNNLKKIQSLDLSPPKLVIINQCWSTFGEKIINEFRSKNIPVITTEHGSPMLYYELDIGRAAGSYRGNLRGSFSHPTWGKVGRDIMIKLGCNSKDVPPLGSPRIEYYFSNKEKQTDKQSKAVIFGTKAEGSKPWSVSIESKVKTILDKHDHVQFKGKVLGPMSLLGLESIDKDFSSDDFYNLFNNIGHAYFWFPSTLITIAKIMGCKTYALYSDSECKYTSNYFKEHQTHILSYSSNQMIDKDSDRKFLENNLTPNGTENIFNHVTSNFDL